MTTLASGSSVMKMGYMSIDFVNVLFCCHDRERGCWYPPCRIDLEQVSKPTERFADAKFGSYEISMVECNKLRFDGRSRNAREGTRESCSGCPLLPLSRAALCRSSCRGSSGDPGEVMYNLTTQPKTAT